MQSIVNDILHTDDPARAVGPHERLLALYILLRNDTTDKPAEAVDVLNITPCSKCKQNGCVGAESMILRLHSGVSALKLGDMVDLVMVSCFAVAFKDKLGPCWPSVWALLSIEH